MKNKMKDYRIFTIFAVLATIVCSIATYDISVRFTPPNITLFGFAVTASFIGLLTPITLDGVYILLDTMLPKFHTTNSRKVAFGFMIFIWVIMVSMNLSSAVINNQIDSAVLGKFSFVVYGVKLVALLYLAFYTYIRYDDPTTKHTIIETQNEFLFANGINQFLERYNKGMSDSIAAIFALEDAREMIEKRTGKDITYTLGKMWRKVLVSRAGIALEIDDKGNVVLDNMTIEATPASNENASSKKKSPNPASSPAPVEAPTAEKPKSIWNTIQKITGTLPAGEVASNGNGHGQKSENF